MSDLESTREQPSPRQAEGLIGLRARFAFTLILPWALRVSDGDYVGKYGRSGYAIQLSVVEESRGDPGEAGARVSFRLATGELTEASKGAEVPGAMLRYTKLVVGFAGQVSAIPVPDAERMRARRAAHRFVNHFLDLYRFTAKDHNVSTLTWAELHEVRAGHGLQWEVVPDDPERLQQACGGGPIMLRAMGVAFRDEDPASVRIGPRAVLSEVEAQAFRENLAAGRAPNVPALLLLNAERHRSACEFRFGILEASTALDIVAEHVAVQLAVRLGETEEGARERLEGVSTVRLGREIIASASGIDLDQWPEWRAWVESHRRLRNRIVHDGYEPTEGEATDALSCIRALTERLDEVL